MKKHRVQRPSVTEGDTALWGRSTLVPDRKVGTRGRLLVAWDRLGRKVLGSILTAPTNLPHSQHLMEAFDTYKAFDTNCANLQRTFQFVLIGSPPHRAVDCRLRVHRPPVYPWVAVTQLLLHDSRGCAACKQRTGRTVPH